MGKKIIFFIGVFWMIIQISCMPYREEQLTEIAPDARDSICQQIFDFQDEQNIEKLYGFFNHKNPTYRYLAASAFGSIKDSTAVDSLATLLGDELDDVRAVAAFALGQTGATAAAQHLINAFAREDTGGVYNLANRAILEAIGKCGDRQTLQFLSTTTTYMPTDTFLLEGQAWGIYRFALRNITVPEGTERMISLVESNDMPLTVRFIGANYLFRARDIGIDSLQTIRIANVFASEEDPRIRMSLAVALGKSKNAKAFSSLKNALSKEEDYRVKCNIIRALGNFPYEDVTPLIYPLLKDENHHVAVRASQHFLENGLPQEATAYWNWAKEVSTWEPQLNLYRAANRLLPVYYVDHRNNINAELRERYIRSNNPYEKAACLRALAEFGWNYRYVLRESQNSEYAAVRTAGVESLAFIVGNDGFRSTFTSSANFVTREIANLLKIVIETGDAGMVATAAEALQNPDRNFKAYLKDSVAVFSEIQADVEVPRDLETFNVLQQLIDYLSDNEPQPSRKPEFSHPIDWSGLTGLEKKPRVDIVTPKGKIQLELFPDISPGSVINFLELARSGLYDNIAFHRVVPNFVIQGGCPNGDGWGGVNYTIRSELSPLHYDQEGYLGMASAGNHTEGSQFFITHSPTPHLDGNYTIFGKVIKGMDVVHQIQLGDIIETVEVL